MLMNKKEFYASPEAETFEVRFEGTLLVASEKADSANSGYDDYYDMGEI